MAYSTRRYSYDDDSASAQGLWVVVLVVAAMVGSFLFGRYVLGERLKPSASPVRNADSSAEAGAAAAATTVQPDTGTAAVSITPEPASGDTLPAPDPQATLNAAIERARSGDMAGEPTTTAPEEIDTEADRQAAEQQRAKDEADRKKKQQEEEARRKKEKEEQARRDAAAAAAAEKPKPKPATPPAETEKPKPKPAVRPAPPPLAPGEKPQPSAAPDPTQAAPAAAAETTKPDDVNYRVRVGTFSTADQAAQRQAELKAKGHDAYVRAHTEGGRTVYDVQAGAYGSRDNAQAKADELRQDGFSAETTSSR